MAEPTLVSYTESTFNDSGVTDETTASVSWLAGDLILVFGLVSNNSTTQTLAVPTATGLTFTQAAAVNTADDNNDTRIYLWTATAAGDGSSAVTSVTGSIDAGLKSGIAVLVYRGSDGIGTPVTLDGSTAKTISVTRAQANSHVAVAMGDWNQVGDDTVTATPTGTVRHASAESGQADFFVVTYPDQGATGTTAYGIASHTGTVDMSGIAVEIKGTAGGGGGNVTTKTMTDSLDASEATVRWLRRRRDSSETLTVFDDPNRTIGMIVNDFSLDVADEEVQWARRNRLASDNVQMADGFVQWRRFRRSADDTLTLLDQVIKTVTGAGILYTKVMSEAIEFADGFVRWLQYRRLTEDTLDILDAFSKLIAGAGITYARILSDSVQMIDDTGNRWTFRRNLMTDTLQVPDQLVQGAIRGRVMADAVTFTDVLTQWVRLVRQLGEDIEFSDGTVKVRRMLKTATDALDLSDELIRSLFLDQLQPTNFRLGIGIDPFVFGMGRSLLN